MEEFENILVWGFLHFQRDKLFVKHRRNEFGVVVVVNEV